MKIKRTNKLKTNSSGFGHIEMLLLVVAVVVIGGVGFFVYQNHNKKTSKALAGSWALLGTQNINNSTVNLFACAQYTPFGSTPAWTIKLAMTQSNPNANITLNSDVYTGSTHDVVQVFDKTVNGSFYFLPDKLINPKNLDRVFFDAVGSNSLGIVSYIGGDPKLGSPGFGAFGNPLYSTSYFSKSSGTYINGPKGALPSCS
jgi:hypothetical protein